MLVQLVYASRSVKPVDSEMIDGIFAQSRKNNSESGITGVLCVCHGDTFLQVLEGGRQQVNQLYAKLVQDPRHRDVTLLHYSEIVSRQFSAWRMGRADLDKVNLAIILKYSEHTQLDPFRISGAIATALLEELIDTASVMGGS